MGYSFLYKFKSVFGGAVITRFLENKDCVRELQNLIDDESYRITPLDLYNISQRVCCDYSFKRFNYDAEKEYARIRKTYKRIGLALFPDDRSKWQKDLEILKIRKLASGGEVLAYDDYSPISEEELIGFLKNYEESYKESVEGCKYVINKTQAEKVSKVFNFFLKVAEKRNSTDCKIEVSKLDPKEEVVSLTAEFYLFIIRKDEIQEFSECVSYCSAFGIHSQTDGKAIISCTIPKVFLPVIEE